jgi:hypothetical protein
LQNPDDNLIPKANKAIAILRVEEGKNQDAEHGPDRREDQQEEGK